MLNLFQKVSDFCLFIYFLSSWRDRMLHSQIINIYIFKSSRPLAITSNETVDDIDREVIQIKLRQIKAFSIFL